MHMYITKILIMFVCVCVCIYNASKCKPVNMAHSKIFIEIKVC